MPHQKKKKEIKRWRKERGGRIISPMLINKQLIKTAL